MNIFNQISYLNSIREELYIEERFILNEIGMFFVANHSPNTLPQSYQNMLDHILYKYIPRAIGF